MKRSLALLLVIASCHDPGTEPGNLIYNGGFECEGAPPPGWAIWGPERHKKPEYVRTVRDHPSRGRACLRLDHPAGTAALAATHPRQALRPKKAHAYSVVFWARADRPRRALFGFAAYSNLLTWTNAPSPGTFPLDVDPQWKRFEFEIVEGIDFRVETSPYLLLTFRATCWSSEQGTLWIDDVCLRERPVQVEPLIDETRLQAPVPKVLRPGRNVVLTLKGRAHRANRGVGGLAFRRLVHENLPFNVRGEWNLPSELEDAIRQLRLPLGRIFNVGEEPFDLETSLDCVAELSRRCGIGEMVIELEDSWSNRSLPPEVWEQAVRYSKERGCNFKWWEVGNEPYACLWGEGRAYPDADAYIRHLRDVYAAVKRADPEARVGVSVRMDVPRWGGYVLQRAAGCYDFVVAHYYSYAEVWRTSPRDLIITENAAILRRVREVQALINACNPGRAIPQVDTEWGMHSQGPDDQPPDQVPQNANLIGTLHRAVRMIEYLREGSLQGAAGWQILSPVNAEGFAVLFMDAPAARSLLYWLYFYFNRHVGEWVTEVDGALPHDVAAVATEDDSSRYLILANASWSAAYSCRTSLVGATTAVVLSDFRPGDPAVHSPRVDHKEDAVRELLIRLDLFELPARSVMFVTVPK